MDELEVYENAPVVLVALEVRHPAAGPLAGGEIRSMKRRLSRLFPLESTGQAANLHVQVGGSPPEVTVETFPRFQNRAKTMAASFKREAILLETSDYPGWAKFAEVIRECLDARTAASTVDGIERVGLRYIDEIRVPIESGTDWADWIDDSLMGPGSEAVALPLTEWQGVGVYGSQPGQTLVIRYGPRVGYAVDPTSELRRLRLSEGGPFFLIDIDSFWTPSSEVPEFDPATVMLRCEELHKPVRRLFEDVITDRLRDEVLRVHE